MMSESVRAFLTQNHNGVLTTFRRSGAAQMSIVTCGLFRDGVACTTTAGRAKLANLLREPRCSLMVSQADWRGYVVLEGRARVLSAETTDAEGLRLALREVYRSAASAEHPDWEEYDRAMREDGRVAIVVEPEHVYGTRV